jgi:hypothetical protein
VDLLDEIVLPVTPSVTLDLDELERDWREGNFDNELDAVRNAQHNIPRLIAELRQLRSHHARPSPNGQAPGAFKHVCAACGREFSSNRRQLPGKKSWCDKPECRKVAATERAQAYRDRKTMEAR